MTLAQIIKLRTNSGRDVIDFLVNVMRDRYEDFRICHRMQAAKLLTTYGNEDAPDFIDDNPRDSSSSTRTRKPRRQTKFDEELARIIREDTRGGRSVAYFLIEVMEGGRKEFMPHHRMSAARELLDRGFGKSARNESTKADPLVHPEPVEGPRENGNPGAGESLTPHSSPLTPGEALTPHSSPLTPENNAPVSAASIAVLEEPGQQPEPETTPRIDVMDYADYLLDIYDSPLYEFMCECEHPDFDPYFATIDEEYYQSFTDCTDPECEVHGEPDELDFDPNDYHY